MSDESKDPVHVSVPLAEVMSQLRTKMEETRGPAPEPDGLCHWCHKDCGGTCLGLPLEGGPVQMKPSDPAYFMLKDDFTSRPEVHKDGCYICEDPEFAAMGLPLCRPCSVCQAKEGDERGHIPADDSVCSVCGYDEYQAWEEQQSAG